MQPLTIDPAKDSTDDLTFKVKALRRTDAGDEARITAYFSRNKRPCGLVRRAFEIPKQAGAVRPKKRTTATTAQQPPIAGRLDVRADLDSDVLVVVRNPSGDLKNFQVEVHTNLLKPDEYTPGPIEWTFSDITSEVVYGMFSQFEEEGKSSVQRLDSLNGAGNELWDKAPANFVDLYWKLIDRKQPAKTIAIVSEEPYVPWELMAPYRHVDSLPVFRDLPLGAEFTIARWTTNEMITAPQTVPLTQSRVVVPRYTRDPLKHAEEEVAVVLASVRGERIDPADFDGLNKNIGVAKASLLHFACHGVGNLTDSAGKRGTRGSGGEARRKRSDARFPGGARQCLLPHLFRQRPLVFLNACEVGQPAPALNGIGGLAQAFINLGDIRRFGRDWWAPGAAAVAGLAVVFMYLGPVVFDPLFNQFKALPAGETRDDVLALAKRAGVDVGEVYEVDASPPHDRRQRLRHRPRPHEARRALRHAAQGLHARRDAARRRARARPRGATRDVPGGLLRVALVAPFGTLVVARATEKLTRDGRPRRPPRVSRPRARRSRADDDLQPALTRGRTPRRRLRARAHRRARGDDRLRAADHAPERRRPRPAALAAAAAWHPPHDDGADRPAWPTRSFRKSGRVSGGGA